MKAKIGVSRKSGGCQIRVVGREYIYLANECLKVFTRSIKKTFLSNFLDVSSKTQFKQYDTKLETINDIYIIFLGVI